MGKGLEDLFDDAKKKGAALFGSLKSATREKLRNTIENLNKSLPVLREAGFELVRLDVDIAILPRLFARFKQVHEIPEAEQKAILEKTKSNKLLHLILLGLLKAAEVRPYVNIDGMDLQEIEIEIGLTPSAKLIFRNEERMKLLE